MKRMKKICAGLALALTAAPAMAGGLLTNTNQNASFLRQMSQNGVIDITGLYVNPAGTAFLEDGWHLSLNSQSAFQTRTIDTTFPLFALNSNNHEKMHEFEGKATAPVIPSFQLSYNHDKWSVNANFALVGGGGKCEFKNGLGSFEALYAGSLYQQVPAGVNAKLGHDLPGQLEAGLLAAGVPAPYNTMLAQTATYNSQMTGYSINPYMKGRQYYFGLTLGATYKITEDLAVFGGLRGVYATCNYNGYVQDVKANYAYQYAIAANPALGFPGTSGGDTGSLDLASNNLTLNTDQTGFAITPIIGFDYRINDQWNVSMKYEMTTNMTLKNTSEMNETAQQQAGTAGSPLAQFKDGEKVREDIPGIITVGAQYSPVSVFHINAGMNYYMDKNALKYGDKQNLLDDNTLEVTAGLEWDVCKLITVSASMQSTNYSMSDAYMNDLSFNLSSNSVGCGFRINATERCAIDFGYMHTFYQDRTVNTQTAAGVKTDLYNRTNNVVGVGVNLAF